jgi:uncharacterized delta-60 repeat protein
MPMRAATPVLVALLLATLAVPAAGAPGDLDPSFDGDGVRTVDWGNQGDQGRDVLVQPDGKIVVVGVGYAAPEDMGLMRLGSDGSLDTGFAGDGTLAIGLGAGESGHAVALAPDGKIVAVGESGTGLRGLVARVVPDGTLDNGFGLNGTQTLEYGGEDSLEDVLVQPDAKIVTVGHGGAGRDLVVTRLIATGLPDGAFNGGAGSIAFDFGGVETGTAIARQGDGKILAAGISIAATNVAILVRVNANGTPDTSFDGDGRLTVAGPAGNLVNDVLLQPDGKIVLVGHISAEFPGGGTVRVTRLEADGTLDRGFGTNGTASFDFGGESTATAGALLANGKIVVAGDGGPGGGAVARLQPGGALDTTFGAGGKALLPASIAHVEGAALQPDGRIVVAGTSSPLTPWDVGVARLDNDSPAAGGPGGGGPGGGPGGGGGGRSVPRCSGKRATIVGTGRSERLKGTRRADVIVALGGNDRIAAGRGNDLICGGNGNDTVDGGSGNDRLYGQNGTDKLGGGGGKDSLSGGTGKDRLAGGGGRDSCTGGSGRDRAACEKLKSI